jgi:predicted Fe-Mo cluster-binding NifX family protein
MLILIPVDGTDEKLSEITTIANLNKWALVDFDEGMVKNISFYDDRNNTGSDWIDFIILENKFENYLDFMNEGMMVLIRREEQTIEDILEAFRFKELDEAGL